MFNPMKLVQTNGRTFTVQGFFPIASGTLENPPKSTTEYEKYAVLTQGQWLLVNVRDIERVETELPAIAGANSHSK
jgi:hypothetical protein